MTRSEAYQYGIQMLKDVGIQEASLDAWILFEEATQVTRAAYYADADKVIGEDDERQYIQWLNKRALREPLQHILGFQEFMGLKFFVTPDVLIPRQDTETLVEYTETLLRESNTSKTILDMCTGSGCILLSLMKRNQGIHGTAADISKEALEVAKKNAKELGVTAEFVQSDLFANVEHTYNMIVSNPPYIRENEIKELETEVRMFDPFIALSGGEDGLRFYQNIIDEGRNYLIHGGSLILEIGCEQANDVRELMKLHGFEKIKVVKDLAGLDRIVHGVYNK